MGGNHKLLLGNEAIARGAIEAGCRVAYSYPGTPSSEILPAFERWARFEKQEVICRWAINEKVAYELALAAAYTGLFAMVSMKQVGLNVAMDPFMSSAYTGVKGALVLVSVDDPGPHSSQTEQDSRQMALAAKVPVIDSSSPAEAKEAMKEAFRISQRYQIPVMVRPVLRVAHSRQNVELSGLEDPPSDPSFDRDPSRWAATPVHRYRLHLELNRKIQELAKEEGERILSQLKAVPQSALGIVASGIGWAYAMDALGGALPIIKVEQPYPVDREAFAAIQRRFAKLLVLEETDPLLEASFPDSSRVFGRLTGHIPSAGELTPESIKRAVEEVQKIEINPCPEMSREGSTLSLSIPSSEEGGGVKPRLCPGCGHRPVFYLMKRLFPKGIFPGDIGCYTLGVNLGAVDTCLCMGAAVSIAAGLQAALKGEVPILATIGDSTFYHSGIPPLVDAVESGASFVLVILDNSTTAMTGGQPTPAQRGPSIESIVRGCGVPFVRSVHTYQMEELREALKEAGEFALAGRGVAVLLCESPCVVYGRVERRPPVSISDKCTGCGVCVERFECPALYFEGEKAEVDTNACTGCGACLSVCPVGAIETQD